MNDLAITAIFATVAAAIIGWFIGYLMGKRDGRSIGWLERYYAELDAKAKRVERFNRLHPRINGAFAEATREEDKR